MKKFIALFICLSCMSFARAKDGSTNSGYRGYVDFALGEAYNPNAVQRFSSNNFQLYSDISTTHGYRIKKWFVGGGIGYYHSFRDKENIYPVFLSCRYTFDNVKINPYIETRAGVVYDPRWISTIQAYGALNMGMKVYKNFQLGLKISMFSRPTRYFAANAAVVLSYEIGN